MLSFASLDTSASAVCWDALEIEGSAPPAKHRDAPRGSSGSIAARDLSSALVDERPTHEDLGPARRRPRITSARR